MKKFGWLKTIFIFAMLSGMTEFYVHGGEDDAMTATLRRNWQELQKRRLRLLPVPKKIDFCADAIVLTGSGSRKLNIVLSNNYSPRARLAANEIVSRLKELAPDAEATVGTTEKPDCYNIIIENPATSAFHRFPQLPEAAKTEQAYVILPGNNRMLLSGSGETGMLYAAVTLRWLIDYQDSRVVLYPARVVDWPDFKIREAWDFRNIYLSNEFRWKFYTAHVLKMEKLIDLVFRFKYNSIREHSFWLYHNFSPFSELPYSEAQYQVCREINDYAAARGISSLVGDFLWLGRYPKDAGRPETAAMLLNKTHSAYYSWGRLDLHRLKAQKLAEFCRKTNTSRMYLHTLDGGGIADPEKWSERDEATRRTYGDDRARADADMFTVYVEELQKNKVQPIVIPYPYTANYLDEDIALRYLGLPDIPESRREVRLLQNKLRDWMTEFDKRLKPDVPFCLREGRAANIAAYRRYLPGRPCWFYYEVARNVRDLNTLLPLEIRTFKTAYRPGANQDAISIFFGTDKFNEQCLPAVAEYMWNTAFPGAAELDRREGIADAAADPCDYDAAAMAILAERTAVGFWGYEAGMILKGMFNRNLSFGAAADPYKAAAQLTDTDIQKVITATRTAVAGAETAMDEFQRKLIRHKQSGSKTQIIDAFTYPWFVQYYEMVKAAAIYTAADYHYFRAGNFIRNGDWTAAEKEIDAGRRDVTAAWKEYDRICLEQKQEPHLVTWNYLSEWDKQHLESRLLKPEPQKLLDKLNELDKNKYAIFKKYNVPDDWKEVVWNKPVVAVKTPRPVVVDGRLDDPQWRTAPPSQWFIGQTGLAVPDYPVTAKTLYDRDKVYFCFAAERSPLLENLFRGTRIPRGMAMADWYLQPENSATVYHLSLDSDGNLTAGKIIPPERLERRYSVSAVRASEERNGVWSCEVAIPLNELGLHPDQPWRGIVVYSYADFFPELKIRSYVNTCAAAGYLPESPLPPVTLCPLPPNPAPERPELRIGKVKMRNTVHSRGSGTEVTFGLEVEPAEPLRNIKIIAQFLNKDKKLLEEHPLHIQPYMALFWKAPRDFRIQLEEAHPFLYLKIIAAGENYAGQKIIAEKTVALGDVSSLIDLKECFSSGKNPNTAGFSFYGFFDTAGMLSPERGALEFMVKPNWNGNDLAGTPGKGLFHSAVYHRRYPVNLNYRAMALFIAENGYLIFKITNADNDCRSIESNVGNWRKGEWHHVAAAWDTVSDGHTRMTLFIDGKAASTEIFGNRKTDPQSALQPFIPSALAQLGSFTSGMLPADATIVDFRLYPAMKFTGNFIPPQDLNRKLDENGLHFSLDRTLRGEWRKGNTTGTAVLKLGPQFKP